jgi:hypothetical protein
MIKSRARTDVKTDLVELLIAENSRTRCLRRLLSVVCFDPTWPLTFTLDENLHVRASTLLLVS